MHQPSLPAARGPLSSAVIAHLRGARPHGQPAISRTIDPLVDDDLHLALWCCYQLHYGGFASVDDRLEWDPDLLRLRSAMEAAFEGQLREECHEGALPDDAATALRVVAEWSGPPLARSIERDGTIEHLRELAIHRSAYQLKEADGHSFGIPRIQGPGRAALLEIQFDEYGNGRPGEAHADLFAAAMEDLGLDPRPGAYVDRLPGTTLATDNLVSMFGLHRRLRGALVGHLALFEMCSVVPMSRYLTAARRVGGLPNLARFYEVHVEADAHHSRLALHDMVGGFVSSEPARRGDVVFGAVALAHVEGRFARRILASWDRGRSSLLPEPVVAADAPADLAAPEPRRDLVPAPAA